MKVLFIIVAVFSYIASAQAETRYIVDQAKLPMRSGQSTGHSIVRMLPSGTAVVVLGQSSTGYTHIRTPSGKDGWILSRYLMKEPAARARLASVEKELRNLHTLKQEKKTLEQERSQLTEDNKKLQAELTHIRKTATNAVAIADENKSLKAKAAQAEQTLEALRQETSDIRSGSQQRWFMLGGGTILFGILLGLILPRLKVRRKDRWGRY
ncbi:MAG: TIGR04211 family SH3 domain-containing protein [Mariprofundus sp.]|nr:TIGR04211 family SH3 domain-containing protein [Mariprofundus sp.]